jgi:hypothetical protein
MNYALSPPKRSGRSVSTTVRSTWRTTPPTYLDNLIEMVHITAITDPTVLNVMDDEVGGGRRASVWDGNHHLVAARELGISPVPPLIKHNLESQHPGHSYHGEFDDEDLAEHQALNHPGPTQAGANQ